MVPNSLCYERKIESNALAVMTAQVTYTPSRPVLIVHIPVPLLYLGTPHPSQAIEAKPQVPVRPGSNPYACAALRIQHTPDTSEDIDEQLV